MEDLNVLLSPKYDSTAQVNDCVPMHFVITFDILRKKKLLIYFKAHEIKNGTFSYRYCYCVYRTRYHAHDVYTFAVFLAKQDTNSIFNIG